MLIAVYSLCAAVRDPSGYCAKRSDLGLEGGRKDSEFFFHTPAFTRARRSSAVENEMYMFAHILAKADASSRFITSKSSFYQTATRRPGC